MKNTEYTFAVARIRCNEARLLTNSDLNSLITATGYEEACRRLRDKGYEIEGTDFSVALRHRFGEMWELISSVLPDKNQFDSIIIVNDFQNLKVALKALVCDIGTDGLFSFPSKYDPEEIKRLVFAHEFSRLPAELAEVCEEAYHILVKTNFAQLADGVIDAAALSRAIQLSNIADNDVMRKLAQLQAGIVGIKTLYRANLVGKAESFMLRCICDCDAFDKSDIVKAATGTSDELLSFISHTDFAGADVALAESPAAFEKWCDDRRREIIKKYSSDAFGIAPLAAYYFAVDTEVKNIRIILSAKLNGFSEETIRERVRTSYV